MSLVYTQARGRLLSFWNKGLHLSSAFALQIARMYFFYTINALIANIILDFFVIPNQVLTTACQAKAVSSNPDLHVLISRNLCGKINLKFTMKFR